MRFGLMFVLALPFMVGCQPEATAPKHTPEQKAEIEQCVEHFIRNYGLTTGKLTPPPVPRSKLVEGCTWRVEEGRTWILEDFELSVWK